MKIVDYILSGLVVTYDIVEANQDQGTKELEHSNVSLAGITIHNVLSIHVRAWQK